MRETKVGLSAAASLPAVLPKDAGVGHHVEHVVDDLKRQPERLAIAREGGERSGIGPTGQRPHLHAGQQQGAGFAAVHVFELGQAQAAADAGQIDRLPAGHA